MLIIFAFGENWLLGMEICVCLILLSGNGTIKTIQLATAFYVFLPVESRGCSWFLFDFREDNATYMADHFSCNSEFSA